MQPEKQVHSVRSSTSSAGPPCMSIAPLQVAMVSAVLLVVAYGLSFPSVCDKDGTVGIFCKVHTGARWETFPVFLGIAIFAIEGIPTVLAIENSMQEPHRFEEVFDRSQAMLTVVFLTFGTLGYWLYGNNTKSVITLNVQGMWGILVKCLLCLVIALSFPLQFMPAGHVLKMFSEHPLFLRAAGAVLDTELVRTRLPAASGLSVEQTSAYGWAGLKASKREPDINHDSGTHSGHQKRRTPHTSYSERVQHGAEQPFLVPHGCIFSIFTVVRPLSQTDARTWAIPPIAFRLLGKRLGTRSQPLPFVRRSRSLARARWPSCSPTSAT
mmetsp:Transcript_4857/g.15105  ORF Transcript_4857/g.15105 Transcript_4857/m.15105 type:complete len:325 (-) Transcript_4857:1434-2408(-)